MSDHWAARQELGVVPFPSPPPTDVQANRQLAGCEMVSLLCPVVLDRVAGWRSVGDPFLDIRPDLSWARGRKPRSVFLLSLDLRRLLESTGVAPCRSSGAAARALITL